MQPLSRRPDGGIHKEKTADCETYVVGLCCAGGAWTANSADMESSSDATLRDVMLGVSD